MGVQLAAARQRLLQLYMQQTHDRAWKRGGQVIWVHPPRQVSSRMLER